MDKFAIIKSGITPENVEDRVKEASYKSIEDVLEDSIQHRLAKHCEQLDKEEKLTE